MRDCPEQVGRVLRASTVGFAIGVRVLQPELPTFGTLVKVQTQVATEVLGLIYDVLIDDDPFVRQLIAARELRDEDVLDQRQNRQVPAEVSVLAVGYRRNGTFYHLLPPQPPAALDCAFACDDAEVRAFTNRTDYFRIVLQAQGLPADELLAASLREGERVRGGGGRQFLIECGRELARLLAMDPVRLDGILRRLRA
ncbi:MAG: hypothetical protein IT330_09780 [Anaerolineae bacterium]|nr:hypothetical protein [Anaerolineae bacterium]